MEDPARARVRMEPGAGHDGPARLYWRIPDDGCPTACFRLDGRPLEVRIWHRELPAGYSAVRHPSGVWIALTVLDS